MLIMQNALEVYQQVLNSSRHSELPMEEFECYFQEILGDMRRASNGNGEIALDRKLTSTAITKLFRLLDWLRSQGFQADIEIKLN